MDGFGLLALIAVVVLTIVGGVGYALYRLANPTRTAGDRLRELSQGADTETPMAELISTGEPASPLLEQVGRFAA
nr:hypothetical protein [Deltaproteobacteria bacterium]